MNQQNNNESLLQKDLNKIKEQIKFDPVLSNTVRSMLVDFVVNKYTYEALSEKYHFTVSLVKEIAIKFSFAKKKNEYEKKIIDHVLMAAQKKQTKLIAKIIDVVNEQVNRIYKMQQSDPNYIISNNHMKDLLASLTIFQKEYRLDNNKSTDNFATQVLVQFADSVPIVTENHIKQPIEVQVEETQEDIKIIEQSSPEDYKDADMVDDHVNNEDFFGVLEE